MSRLYKNIYLSLDEIGKVYRGLELVWKRYVPTPTPTPNPEDSEIPDFPDPGDGHNPKPPRETHTGGGIKLLISRFVAIFVGWLYDF